LLVQAAADHYLRFEQLESRGPSGIGAKVANVALFCLVLAFDKMAMHQEL
jgi:hypothetical protein